MVWLVLGVLVWSVVHASRSGAPALRARLVARLGADPYRGLFSLVILSSVALMVVGWRATTPRLLYAPPLWGHGAALALMFVALVLFAASGLPTNIKRAIRHPQLTGVALWSLAHLLANGDSRSLVLFSVLGIWALLEMVLINRREGAWQRPLPLPLSAEVKPLLGGLVAYVILLLVHPYLFGVAALRF
jgi:uncharacterized membrane protein